MDRVIQDHSDELNAMYRPEVGGISFYWGKPGTPEKQFTDGGGVSHIIARRNLEGQDGEGVARKLIEVLAKGEVTRTYGPTKGTRVEFTHDGHTAVLSLYRFGDRQTWLLTGWKDDGSDAPGESNNRQGYAQRPSGSRASAGAEPQENITPLGGDGKPPFQGSEGASQVLPRLMNKSELRDFLTGRPIASMEGKEVPVFSKLGQLADWIGRYFQEEYGGKSVNPDLGEVIIDRRSVKSSISHGMSRPKAQAFYLVPEIISKGRVAKSAPHPQKEGILGHFLVASIEIGGKEYVAIAIVTKDANLQRFYLHEVIPKEELQGPSKTGTPPEERRAGSGPTGAIRSLIKDIFDVNPEKDGKPLFQGGPGVDITDTPAFKKWFGDSKVVDGTGKPLVIYHGRRSGEWELNHDMKGYKFRPNEPISAFKTPSFFSDRPDFADLYGSQIYPVYLKIENPWKGYVDQIHSNPETIRKLISEGYDGAIGVNEHNITEYVAFSPEQIKSVFNRGTFDPDNPDILHQSKPHPKGAIQFLDDMRGIIHLFKGSDVTTPIHEVAHAVFEHLPSDDFKIVADWLGKEDPGRPFTGKDFGTEDKENFARGFEVYLMEGRAPSLKLRDVFAKLKKWFFDIYRSIRALGVELNDEMRSLYDRLLAKEVERKTNLIEQLNEEYNLNAGKQPTAEMLDEYDQLMALARQRADKVILDRVKKREDKIYRDAEKWAREAVKDEPIYRLMDYVVKHGGFSLKSLDALGYGNKEMLNALRKKRGGLWTKAGKIQVDQIAMDTEGPWDGSPDALIDMIVNGESRQDAVSRLVSEYMNEYSADIQDLTAEKHEAILEEEIKALKALTEKSTKDWENVPRKGFDKIVNEMTGVTKMKELKEKWEKQFAPFKKKQQAWLNEKHKVPGFPYLMTKEEMLFWAFNSLHPDNRKSMRGGYSGEQMKVTDEVIDTVVSMLSPEELKLVHGFVKEVIPIAKEDLFQAHKDLTGVPPKKAARSLET